MARPGRAHVVGAGLAGLAASVALARAGHRVTLYESSDHAGGRCRSFFDAGLDCRIDNGNHLLLAGNTAAMAYLAMTGARDTVEGPDAAILPFVDLASGERWQLRPNQGRLPWWVLCRGRRVPGTTARDYLAALRLRHAAADAVVTDVFDPRSLAFRRLWQPFAVAALNTAAIAGSARLFGRIVAETLGRGGAACLPLMPRDGLSESFVDPAVAELHRRSAEIRFRTRVRGLEFADDAVTGLSLEDGSITIGPGEAAVLAVPAVVAARLVPGLTVPDDDAPIVNAHFRCATPAGSPPFTGIVGGTAEWVFRKRKTVSVTVSAADALVDRPSDELAAVLWGDVARVYRVPAAPMPPVRIVKEKRATFRATPAQLRRRPPARTGWNNLVLAGDYVDTGLPATIEGAIRSGLMAAELIAAYASRSDPWPGAARPSARL